jgi:hypothetical protein
MYRDLKSLVERFKSDIPEYLDTHSREQTQEYVKELLGVSLAEPTLRQYSRHLRLLVPTTTDKKGRIIKRRFSYCPYDKGFDRVSLLILCVYKFLIKTMGGEKAVNMIEQQTEEVLEWLET